ncbi:MAG: NAD+ synthase [Candidatus Omnitrophota bacterium]|jgi:NAD+ synthase|nr:NAD+ synthase [Candidatus Omnitrophota bacterium]
MKDKIVAWIRKKAKDAKAKGIILGLSGGIDSAVVCALSKEAVGKDNVLGLFMPCHSHSRDIKDAKIVAEKLKIKTRSVNLSGVYDSFLKILPKASNLALANLRPRLRMAALYYFANKFNYLVCGTGNKSELMAGYFTKYGDGGVDILPIAGLLKKDVRRLAKELGIPVQIITKAPTAGLWPGQTDEGEMGITYNELDDILYRLEHKQKQRAGKGKVTKVERMIARSGHKRNMPEICNI